MRSGILTMFTKTRRSRWQLAIGAIGALLIAGALNLRGDRAATSDDVRKSAPAPALARPSPTAPRATPAPAGIPERLHYIVQSESADAARSAVQDVGGLVTRDLSVIRAVGAALDERELAALRDRRVPHVQIYEDTPVHASSL